ncbi:MAG: F0F1 ATP synthase subunit A [Planctomycetota bacterium]|nr:F0F1 ATP synthase subunit A [Planctomycetota bacterium]
MSEEIVPEPPLYLFGLGFNYRTIYMVLVVTGTILLISYLAGRRPKIIPGRLQCAVEMVYLFFREIVEQALGEEHGRKYAPVYVCLFLFIWLSNVIGIIPVQRLEIGGERFVDVNGNGRFDSEDYIRAEDDKNGNGRRDPGFVLPAFKEPTSDMCVTIGLAIFMGLFAHSVQIRVKGIKGYIKDYFSPLPFMFPLNVVGRVVEMLSTSMRLFGNIFGGGVILTVASLFVSNIVMPVPLQLFFGLFAGTVQAFVFTNLWLSYLAVTIRE